MKIDKFDQITEKLLNKLNEDYVLLEGTSEEDADGLQDPKETLQKSLKTKVDKESSEASESFKKIKDFPDSPYKNLNTRLHKKEVIDREDAKNKLRKSKLFNESEIISEDELNDYDMHTLAEEFENDLEEANQQMLNNAKILEATEKNKLEQTKAKYKAEKEQMDQNKEVLAQQTDAQKEKVRAELKANDEKQKQQIKQETTTHDNKYKQSVATHEQKLQKIEAMKNAAKNDPSGGQPMREEYDENVRLFKAEHERLVQLEEGIKHKQKRAKKELDKAYKELDDWSAAESNLASERDELTKKYNIDDDNAEDFESHFFKKRDKRKALKIKQKYAELTHRLEGVHKLKVIPADKKAQAAELKVKRVNEDYDAFIGSCKALIDEIHALYEEYPYDEQFCEEAKRGIKYANDNFELIEENSDNPMVNKIARTINEQLESDNPDYALIKSLKIKLNEYKK